MATATKAKERRQAKENKDYNFYGPNDGMGGSLLDDDMAGGDIEDKLNAE